MCDVRHSSQTTRLRNDALLAAFGNILVTAIGSLNEG